MTSNLGKMIKLYDNGTAFAGNPFASQGAVQAQIWSLGHRNPLGIDWDAQGRLWEVEMGPRGGDELNLIQKGANYGWPLVSEGRHYNGSTIPKHSTNPKISTPPKAFWVPVISPAGLIIYKGNLFSSWKGNAIITGLSSQQIVRVTITGDTAKEAQRISMGKRMRGIREDKDGAIWVLEDGAGGKLWCEAHPGLNLHWWEASGREICDRLYLEGRFGIVDYLTPVAMMLLSARSEKERENNIVALWLGLVSEVVGCTVEWRGVEALALRLRSAGAVASCRFHE